MIVADTSAIVALLDRSDAGHEAVKTRFRRTFDEWILPWAILPEVDYLLPGRVHPKAARTFLSDLASGEYQVEWGMEKDLERAAEIDAQYAALGLGLVDAIVMATAERLKASAIATFDRRHFGVVVLKGRPALFP